MTQDGATLLRAHGLRVTPQRRAILAAFEDGRSGHLTADEVHERAARVLPELSRGTVYNTLGELVRSGLLGVVEGLGAVRYDPNVDKRHQHFRCLACAKLVDVHLEGSERLDLPAPGFVVERTRIIVEGTCPDCSPKAT